MLKQNKTVKNVFQNHSIWSGLKIMNNPYKTISKPSKIG